MRWWATRRALSTWRSMRRLRVSSPCSSRKAFMGASAAPVLRRGTVRTRPMKAAGPKASV
ncbi:hypothetical protein D3C72_1595070 [compost metagenome]